MRENGSRGSVLVVDDDPTVLEIVSRYLGHAGYDTCAAAEGNDAIQLAKSNPPDLVVLDVILPASTASR